MKRAPKFATNVELLDSNDRISDETEEIQSRVRQRAYEISQTRGHSGREVDDWLSAESEVISVPPAELSELDNVFRVQMALAGVNPADLRVMASPEQMLVKADFRHDHALTGGTVHLCDFKSATVFRSIAFPERIDTKSVKVNFEDGLVTITAKKAVGAESERPARRRPETAAAEKRKPKPRAKTS